MKNLPNLRFLSGALLSGLCLAAAPSARALDFNWTNPGVGNWNDPLNWNTGVVPNKVAEWGAANVNNGGTAIVSNLVPAVSEAWAGNSGVAGTIIVTNGGTLPVDNWLVVGRTGAGGNTPLSTLIVSSGGIINKGGDGFIIGDGTTCTGQVSVIGSGQINVTGGWIGIGNGGGGVGHFTLQDDAVFSTTGQDWNVGDYGSGQGFALIKDNARLNVSRFWVGKNDTSFGVLTQTGGAIVGGTGGNEWCIGGESTAATAVYGFYNLIGGTFTNPNNFQIGRYGLGLLYQSGGTLSQGSWCSVGRFTTGKGILYITGGQFIHTGTGQSLMVGEGGSRGEMTLSGSGSVTTSREFAIGNGGTGFVNLNGGTLTVPRIAKWGGSGYLNFNGGTVKPKVSDPSFLGGLNEARVFSGNAIFDTDGYDIGINQPLLGAVGSGVTSIPVADGGSGYAAPPIVEITGDGIGAQAIAQVDPVTGKVTSIVITCPGIAYSTVYSVNFLGGGASVVPATAGTPVISPLASGGLIKNGAGTLTLNGANDFTGATVVNAGGLVMNTAAVGGGAITLANGTTLGLRMHAASAQLLAANITLGTSGNTTLNMDLGGFGNPGVAPLSAPGTLAVNGTVTINVSDDYPQLGAIPLIQYGARSGSGSFVLGPLPTGVTANLATNAINNTIDLVITAVAAPRWDGQAGGTWDLAQTLNWTELSTGLPTYYSDGLVALFDDAALGTTIVNLTNTVTPGGVLVNNTNLAYTITGTGKISGGGNVTKKGTNSLTVLTMNDYTGPTVIQAGTVNVTNLANGGQPSNIGKSSATSANLALAGGTLNYSGAPAATDRGYAVQGAGTGIGVQSDLKIGGKVTASPNTSFVKSGPAKLTYSTAGTNELSGGAFPGYDVLAGTIVFDGIGGTQVNHSQNEFWVGSTTNVGASLILSNTTLNIDSWLAVGRGNGTDNYLSTLEVYNSTLRSGNFSMGWDNGRPNLARQLFTLNGTSAFTNNGDVNIGEQGGSTSTVLLNGNSKFYSGGRTHFGWHNNATGIVTMADSAAMTVNAWWSIGHEGGIGTFTLKNNSSLWVLWDINVTDVGLGEGTLNIQDNATATGNNFFVGKGIGSSGVVNQTGGSAIGILNDGNEYHIGFHGQGTWNLSAGKIVAPNHWFIVGRWSDGPGTLNVTGGTIIHGTNNTGKLFRVGEDGTGVLNLTGAGVIETSCNEVTIGWNATGNGTVNLDGGVFQARRIIGGAGSSVFNFSGGLLRAGPNANANFMTALTGVYVNAGGAKIDTGTNNIAINQDIQPGAGSGGLTISGTGALALNGNCSYIGSTVVSSGGLGGNGTIASPVSVQAGGFLSPGTSVGALTINNTLNLAGTAIMEIDAAAGTNDQVLGVTTLTYGGTLVLTNIAGLPAVGTVYKLFTAGNYSSAFSSVVSANPGITYDSSKLNVDGTVKVLTSVNTTPISIQTSNGLGGLTVSWPADHVGWTLQAQTNPISIGLSNNWAPVPGSTTTNQVTIPINPANGTVFLRLVLP